MGLQEDLVDMVSLDNSFLVMRGFHEGRDTDVSAAAQNAVAGANDEIKGLRAEGAMGKAAGVELAEDIGSNLFRVKARENDRVGDPGFDFLVNGKVECCQKRGKPNENEIVVFREVLKEET